MALPQKRKCEVQDVYRYKLEKHVNNPALVLFRTAQPQDCDFEGIVSREPFRLGAADNHAYASKITITSDEGHEYEDFHHESQSSLAKEDEITLMAFIDKTTNKMKLVEMNQYLVSKKFTDTAVSQLNKTTDVPQAHLDLHFGTKKNLQRHQNHLRQKERQEIGAVGAIEEASNTIADIKVEADTGTDYGYIMPVINEQATVASDVYTTESIVSDEILELLIDDATALMDTKPHDLDGLSPLFKACLASAKLQPEDDIRLKFTCAALFVNLLACVVSGKSLPVNMDKTLKKYFDKNFKASKRFKSKMFQDQALVQLIVLAVIINRCKLSMATVTGSLKVIKPMLQKVLRMLRLKVRGGDIVLTLPLPDPVGKEVMRQSLNKKSKR